MDERLVRFFDDEKYMWDGSACADEDEADKKEQQYRDDGFDVRTVTDGSSHLVYTRRVVAEEETR